MRRSAFFPLDNQANFKEKLFDWIAGQTVAIYLDSNGNHDRFAGETWEVLAGAGALETLSVSSGEAFQSLKNFQHNTADWLFGGLAYDLKNELETLQSEHIDGVGLPDMLFFRPETVVGIRKNRIEIHVCNHAPETIFHAIMGAEKPEITTKKQQVRLQPRISKPDYLQTVAAIRRHIREGDLYEMNLCQEFFAENVTLDPVPVWNRLSGLTQAPMSAFFRHEDIYLLSASPERFLKKEGRRLISQPIKGTRRRAGEADDFARNSLKNSEKDRAENVMIVDLVRNDLARSCKPGSIRVDELFGIYTFKTVHQMISTVSGELGQHAHALDALSRAFPPGSMTGAPKVMAMKLIEHYERTRRGWYAGALGYLDPSGDFDFNVLIRTIFINQSTGYVSAQVGGAIVYDSIPEAEYEECLVKANALFKALGSEEPG